MVPPYLAALVEVLPSKTLGWLYIPFPDSIQVDGDISGLVMILLGTLLVEDLERKKGIYPPSSPFSSWPLIEFANQPTRRQSKPIRDPEFESRNEQQKFPSMSTKRCSTQFSTGGMIKHHNKAWKYSFALRCFPTHLFFYVASPYISERPLLTLHRLPIYATLALWPQSQRRAPAAAQPTHIDSVVTFLPTRLSFNASSRLREACQTIQIQEFPTRARPSRSIIRGGRGDVSVQVCSDGRAPERLDVPSHTLSEHTFFTSGMGLR
ncbi:uncharacterized protein CLUP02_07476 [Colletotrichum lupini]|uniref:Uncharacterized protein n=1 Tax=Colletotrichum lupini TaxID=145971 RepID=A0A9Q8SRB0_9PEZI|nr:uncharacterized protein CLUP02_07476 [Colletotrichum lupini]UQC81990.1 hypothetical protein CLUP02_07476 [Colletotrichum lupini]